MRLRLALSRPFHFILLAVTVMLALIAIWWIWQWLPPKPVPDFPESFQARRAIWLGIEWASEVQTDTAIQTLVNALQDHAVTDVYAYISYLKAGDQFNPTYEHAAEFTQRFRAAAPEIRLWGWIGVPIEITRTDGTRTPNRLEDASIRESIIGFAAQVVGEMGFDGVHLNAEPISNGDAAYIETLHALREQLPAGAMLSVAPHALRLTEPVTSIPYPNLSNRWDAAYLLRVAQEVDQVAIMLYDTGLFTPADYRAWIAYQIRTIATTAATTETEVFVGLPVSEEWTASHHPQAENLANAVQGLRVGLAQSNSPSAIDGIALYPYWEIDADEWRLIDDLPR